MSYSERQLEEIFDRTDGRCHMCKKKLALGNYGLYGRRGCWEVDHCNPRACGGSDHGRNLKAACIDCNRLKGAGSTRSMRQANGLERAPLSREKRQQARERNTAIAGGAGVAIGGALGGPVGAIVGGFLGAALGNEADPD